MTNWAHKILDKEGRIVLFTTTFPDGRNAFYYMLVSRQNRNSLFEAMNGTEKINLDDYGKVVRSGWGEPSEDDKEFMRKNHKADL